MNDISLFACLIGFYGISTFADYLMPISVLFQIIQFSLISSQLNCQKYFYFKLLSKSETVLIQTIHFSIRFFLHS